MKPIRIFIVEDEPPARRKLRRLLEADREVEIVGEAESGAAAVQGILATRPDLLFLDIRIPGDLDGFDVLEALAAERSSLPRVVFITAFDEYAVRAFEVHAVDYILKPFDADRLRRALERAKGEIHQGQSTDSVRALLEDVLLRREPLSRIVVEEKGTAFVLEVDDIDWIESAENYVTLHARGKQYLVRGTLSRLERRLDPSRFVRIHRSRIINLERVAELHPWSHGDWEVVMKDGTHLRLSRRYRARLPTIEMG